MKLASLQCPESFAANERKLWSYFKVASLPDKGGFALSETRLYDYMEEDNF